LRHKIQLDNNIEISFKEAEKMQDKLFDKYPEMYTERERRIQYAWETGTAWSDVGAPIPLYLMPESFYPEIEERYGKPVLPWEIKEVNNRAVNYPTQQFAGYVTGCALLSLQDALASEVGGWGAYLSLVYDSTKLARSSLHTIPIAEVHDEIVTDSQDVEQTSALLKHHMEQGMLTYLHRLCPTFDCPLDVQVESLPYWSKT
jgi:DNA polymerase I-like protein with 3'-5' exonuclease and polymerase domains